MLGHLVSTEEAIVVLLGRRFPGDVKGVVAHHPRFDVLGRVGGNCMNQSKRNYTFQPIRTVLLFSFGFINDRLVNFFL